jgi:hypothetical protein
MTTQQYKLGLADGAYGPGDIAEVTVADEGIIAGPNLPNWQSDYLLVRCLNPTTYHGEELRYLALGPRELGVSLRSIRTAGGVVSVFRFFEAHSRDKPQTLHPHEGVYWAVGVLRPIAANEGST